MAAETKPTLGRRQRPVEFRGLSTHYVAGETICVSFRYPAGSFQPHSDDKIKLYRRGTRAGSLASSLVGDTSKHRLCDGGLYKTGSVSIATSSGFAASSCVLFYGSCSLGQVVGKSEPFTICPQKDFPSIQIRSVEDDVYIEMLRANSPIDDPAAFPQAVGTANGPAADDMSFAVLSNGSSMLGEWEVLGDQHEEEEESGAESDCWSDVAEQVKSSSPLISSKLEESSSDSEEEAPSNSAVPQHTIIKPWEHNVTELAGNDSTEVPVAKTGELKQRVSITSGNATPVANDKSEHEASLSESAHMVSLSDLSGNTVMLKSANKELRTKVRVLHDKLHRVSEERDNLLAVVDNLDSQVSVLKQKNKKLAEDQAVLKAKYRQAQSENTVLTHHCEKQVAQISQYEKHLKTVSSENQQLQRQLHHTTKKSKHHQHHKHSQHQKASTSGNGVTSTGNGVTSGKKKCPSKPAEGVRPVIDVYVRDPKEGTSDITPPQKPVEGGDGVIKEKVVPSVKGEDAESLSEQHIQSIMEQLKGGQQSFVCPVCMRALHSHETEYSAQLHIEQCLLDT